MQMLLWCMSLLKSWNCGRRGRKGHKKIMCNVEKHCCDVLCVDIKVKSLDAEKARNVVGPRCPDLSWKDVLTVWTHIVLAWKRVPVLSNEQRLLLCDDVWQTKLLSPNEQLSVENDLQTVCRDKFSGLSSFFVLVGWHARFLVTGHCLSDKGCQGRTGLREDPVLGVTSHWPSKGVTSQWKKKKQLSLNLEWNK